MLGGRLAVFGVGDMLTPVGVAFGEGQVGHEVVRRGAVPVPFTVIPHFGSLRWAEGAVPTRYGPVSVRWSRDGRRFSATVAVPPQTSAFVDLPDGHTATVRGGPDGNQRTFTG